LEAHVTHLLAFLKGSTQLAMPIFQRHYSWSIEECRQLWDDVVESGGDDQIKDHFLGNILCVADGLYAAANPPTLMVIDGQQRLITVSLLLAALAEALPEDGPSPGGDLTPRKIFGYYLKNDLETGDRRYKLLPTETDKGSYQEALGGPPPAERSERITENLAWFRGRLSESKRDPAVVGRGLSKLRIVEVSLDPRFDDPQAIFESMNSTGVRLGQADLIRNFLLMGLGSERQAEL
jgi:uncharacterized protein with ParB-like and HNH nuclease domain